LGIEREGERETEREREREIKRERQCVEKALLQLGVETLEDLAMVETEVRETTYWSEFTLSS